MNTKTQLIDLSDQAAVSAASDAQFISSLEALDDDDLEDLQECPWVTDRKYSPPLMIQSKGR